MNVSNEQQVIEEAVAQVLRATRANDAETAPARHTQQTDQCPNIARFAAVFKFRGKWTAAEAQHILGGCPFCQKVFNMFATTAAQEDTVMNMDTNQETQVEIPGKKKKDSAPVEKPKPREKPKSE
jgi:hypothetical protein